MSMGIPGHILGVYIPLHSPYIGLIYGRYLHFRILKFPLNMGKPSGCLTYHVVGKLIMAPTGSRFLLGIWIPVAP